MRECEAGWFESGLTLHLQLVLLFRESDISISMAYDLVYVYASMHFQCPIVTCGQKLIDGLKNSRYAADIDFVNPLNSY